MEADIYKLSLTRLDGDIVIVGFFSEACLDDEVSVTHILIEHGVAKGLLKVMTAALGQMDEQGERRERSG